MKKTAFIIMLITFTSKILGFARDVILSYFFGASEVTDAYLISLTIPSVIFGFISVGITTAYIPMFSRILEEQGVEEGNRYTSNFTNIILVIVTLICVACTLFAEPIVKIFAIGFSQDTFELAMKFMKITLIQVSFSMLIAIYTGFLQVNNNYIISSLIGFPLNVIIIISIYMASKGNYYILSIGTVFATISQFCMLIPYIIKKKFKYDFYINFKDENIKKTLYISFPVIIGASVNQINILVDRTIASTLAVGGISALNYASKLNLFIQGLFVTSIITVMYPQISAMASKKKYNDIKKILVESINIINILLIPISVATMVFSKQIIALLFGRGAFDNAALEMTSSVLFFSSIGMIGFALREVLARVFYSLQDTKTPMINAAIGFSINIILNIILSKIIGISGLALATSISALFTTGILFYSLKKKMGRIGLTNMASTFLKTVLAAIIMGINIKYINVRIGNIYSENISFIIASVMGILIYFFVMCLFGVGEVKSLFNKVIVRLGGRRCQK